MRFIILILLASMLLQSCCDGCDFPDVPQVNILQLDTTAQQGFSSEEIEQLKSVRHTPKMYEEIFPFN